MKENGNGKRAAISTRTRAIVMERDCFRCRRCGRDPAETKLVVDHIKPVARGGTNDITNLQTLCELCNGGKSDRPPHDHDHGVGPRTDPVSTLIGCDVLRPTGRDGHCDHCDKPLWSFWMGLIKSSPYLGTYLVQWYEWGMGEATWAALYTTEQITREQWRIFHDLEAFRAATRWVIAQHDHERIYEFRSSINETEPARMPCASGLELLFPTTNA